MYQPEMPFPLNSLSPAPPLRALLERAVAVAVGDGVAYIKQEHAELTKSGLPLQLFRYAGIALTSALTVAV